MRVESLERLSAAVAGWRSEKKHKREKMPDGLLRRVRRGARTHGVATIARALRVDRRRLEGGGASQGGEGGRRSPESAPAYSRVELAELGGSAAAFAELELPSGARLRLYSESAQTLGLLAQVCSAGWAR
jgi:hypothetical protein